MIVDNLTGNAIILTLAIAFVLSYVIRRGGWN